MLLRMASVTAMWQVVLCIEACASWFWGLSFGEFLAFVGCFWGQAFAGDRRGLEGSDLISVGFTGFGLNDDGSCQCVWRTVFSFGHVCLCEWGDWASA